jgi:hypothetical protein
MPATARGLDSAVPDAVRDTLQLFAEIAVEKAKAEGLRILKDKIVKNVCTSLTVKSVLGGDDDSVLLPSTCGQLQTLRISDLGSTAEGLVDALREDIIDVVLPLVADKVTTAAGANYELVKEPARVVLRVVGRLIRRGLKPDDVRLAVVELSNLVSSATGDSAWAKLAVRWSAAFKVAWQCAQQTCSIGDVLTLLDSSGVGRPSEFAGYAQRLIAILEPRTEADARKIAAELVELLGDMALAGAGSLNATGRRSAVRSSRRCATSAWRDRRRLPARARWHPRCVPGRWPWLEVRGGARAGELGRELRAPIATPRRRTRRRHTSCGRRRSKG